MGNTKSSSVLIPPSEWLDSTSAKGEKLKLVLKELDWLNSLLGNTFVLKKYVSKLLRQHTPAKKVVTLLDMGCGSGQNLKQVALFVSSLGYQVKLIAVDINPEILDIARNHLAEFDNAEFYALDLRKENCHIPDHDIAIASHVLYHFSAEELKSIIADLQTKNSMGFVFSELRYSKMGLNLFKLISSMLNKHTRNDGILAYRRSHTRSFWKNIIELFSQVHMVNIYPFRTILYQYK